MIVVDSSVWIDYFNGRSAPAATKLDQFLGEKQLLIGDLILAEVLQGFRLERDYETGLRLLETMPFAEMVGRHIAMQSAANYRKLRAAGVTPRKTIDVLIATFCIERRHSLLHSDRDFNAMAPVLGLEIV